MRTNKYESESMRIFLRIVEINNNNSIIPDVVKLSQCMEINIARIGLVWSDESLLFEKRVCEKRDAKEKGEQEKGWDHGGQRESNLL